MVSGEPPLADSNVFILRANSNSFILQANILSEQRAKLIRRGN